jgi:hypothetical protein
MSMRDIFLRKIKLDLRAPGALRAGRGNGGGDEKGRRACQREFSCQAFF